MRDMIEHSVDFYCFFTSVFYKYIRHTSGLKLLHTRKSNIHEIEMR